MLAWRARSVLTASGAITCAQTMLARPGDAYGTLNRSYLSVVSMLDAEMKMRATINGELPWEVLIVGSVIDSALRWITADGFEICGCVVCVCVCVCVLVREGLRFCC